MQVRQKVYPCRATNAVCIFAVLMKTNRPIIWVFEQQRSTLLTFVQLKVIERPLWRIVWWHDQWFTSSKSTAGKKFQEEGQAELKVAVDLIILLVFFLFLDHLYLLTSKWRKSAKGTASLYLCSWVQGRNCLATWRICLSQYRTICFHSEYRLLLR